MRLSKSETKRALKISREMTDDPKVGYVLIPSSVAKMLVRKGFIKIVGPSPYGEVRAVITDAGRQWELAQKV